MTSQPAIDPASNDPAASSPAEVNATVRHQAPHAEPIDPGERPGFAAVMRGIDLTRTLSDSEIAAIHAALDRYGVLVFRDQPLEDPQQVAFSRQLGPLELATGDIGEEKNRRLSMELNDISNLDRHGEVLPRDDRARLFGLGNRLWHSDSSFKEVPAKY